MSRLCEYLCFSDTGAICFEHNIIGHMYLYISFDICFNNTKTSLNLTKQEISMIQLSDWRSICFFGPRKLVCKL